MTNIPVLAFGINDSRNFDKAAYFAIASWFPSPLVPAILGNPGSPAIPAYPARPASALIPANPANPAIAAGALFKNSPAIAAGAAVPAFAAQAATNPVAAVNPVTAVAAVPAKVGIKPEVLALTTYQSTDTQSIFTVFLPCNLVLEAMYGNKFKAIFPWNGAGNVPRTIADGITLPAISGVSNLEQLLFYYASLPDSGATIDSVVIGSNTYYKISQSLQFTDVISPT
jgi:hypothetical protein